MLGEAERSLVCRTDEAINFLLLRLPQGEKRQCVCNARDDEGLHHLYEVGLLDALVPRRNPGDESGGLIYPLLDLSECICMPAISI